MNKLIESVGREIKAIKKELNEIFITEKSENF